MDATTFQRFYEHTAAALRAYLRLACRDAALADDLLQDTYLRLLRRDLPDLNESQLKAYLYKTAHSVLVDDYRARDRETRWRGEQPSADDADTIQPDTPSGPFELPLDMQRVFDSLPPRQQSLLWLAYVEGFKHSEIADVIDVKAGSVRVMLSRARTELAMRLTEQGLAPAGTRGAKR